MNAVKNARAIGAQTIQIFGASPVRWSAPLPDTKEATEFCNECKKHDISPVFLHAPYLINLASPKKQLAAMSRSLLSKHLEIAHALCARGVIFHIGSRGDMDPREAEVQVINALKTIITEVPRGDLIIENSAGAGNLVGDQLDEVGRILKGVKSERVRFCYDTAHGFAAGVLVDMGKKEVDVFVKKVEEHIGIKNLVAIHMNDSKAPARSNKDRHENIGEGYIGKDSFGVFLSHKKLSTVPVILEVPGFDEKGPDKKNIEIVKKIIYSQ